MDINGGFTTTTYRHRKTPSSDRFLGKFSLSPPPSTDFELTEADLFSFSASPNSHLNNGNSPNHHAFRMPENSGILAALPADGANRVATLFRAIPKPPQQNQNQNNNQRVSSDLKFQHSAPVNVPSMMRNPKKFGQLSEFSEERENNEDDDDDEEEMLPPHEIVAMKLKSTSSVLEGVGRTLKGRDLRQVRNAVWRQTGFLD